MTQPIIEINGLGKKYRIGALREPYLSLRDSLARTQEGMNHGGTETRRRRARRLDNVGLSGGAGPVRRSLAFCVGGGGDRILTPLSPLGEPLVGLGAPIFGEPSTTNTLFLFSSPFFSVSPCLRGSMFF